MKMWKKLLAALAIGVAFAAPLAAASYTQTILTDGTNVWTLVSTNSAASSQMTLDRNGVVVLTFDPVNGVVLQSSLVAALPTCTTALTGAIRVVTDGSTATTGGTLAGSGTDVVIAVCSGTNWIVN